MSQIKKFWEFLNKDTWQSWIVSLVLIVLIIKIIVFPLLSLATSSPLPLVVIESCSMWHEDDFENWWSRNAVQYETRNIEKEQFQAFPFKEGLNKGDIILVSNKKVPELGSIIIFKPNPESLAQHPIIHRTVSTKPLGTKGDHNAFQFNPANNPQKLDETDIQETQILGRAVVRVPLIGWLKLIFFDLQKPESEQGFCR
jgi:signal peptidase I